MFLRLGAPWLDPFVVAVWVGHSKPICVNKYLAKFVEELNNLTEHGIEINNFHLSVAIRAIIADTPARSFLKGEYMRPSRIFFYIFEQIIIMLTS